MHYRLNRLYLLFIIVLCDTPSPLCTDPGMVVPQTQHRLTQVVVLDMRRYGWEEPSQGQSDRPIIAIDHKGRLVVGHTVRERYGLVTRNQPSLEFQFLRLTSNGTIDLSASLPTNVGGGSELYLSDTDEIVVRENDSLQWLQSYTGTSDGVLWTFLTPCTRGCRVTQSYSRHTLLVYNDSVDIPVTIVTLSEPPVVHRCSKVSQLMDLSEDQIYPHLTTDRFAYSIRGGKAYRWRHCEYDRRVALPLDGNGRWEVLNDDSFVANTYDVHAHHCGLKVVSATGEVRFRPTLSKYESVSTLWEPIRRNENGNRIAVDVVTIGGDHPSLDIPGHVKARRIAVYDIASGTEVASISVASKHRYRYKFDLSPDGHRVVVIEDDIVREFLFD